MATKISFIQANDCALRRWSSLRKSLDGTLANIAECSRAARIECDEVRKCELLRWLASYSEDLLETCESMSAASRELQL
jgi:hypothetical protein